MVRRFLILISLCVTASLLTGCLTTSAGGPRQGVAEAKACQKTLQSNPAKIPGYIIRACTNTGVWAVDQLDPAGSVMAQYDFVNGEYAGPETGNISVPVDSLGSETIQTYHALQKTLNHDLRDSL